MKFTLTDSDKRIANFMNMKKENGYWNHPSELNTVSERLGFSYDWQWLMPVVEKIQLEYYRNVVLKEFDQFESSFSSSITILGKSWIHYHWANYDRIKAEIEELSEKAARYGEVYISKHHKIVENKFEAVYECVCRFIEWWEKQEKNN